MAPECSGWAFNSLTYRWAPKKLWGDNPLANTDLWVAPDGKRRWRTECGTPATGRGACRTYVMATVYSQVDGRYRQDYKWVFNNQVLFSES